MAIDKFRLLFFGSDQFSIRVLEPLLSRKICPIQVVTKPHTPLDKYASCRHLSRHFWEDGLDHITDSDFNIGLVASFGNMIDVKSVKRFSYGLFNVHPSLLPQYRGSTPVQSAIFDDLEETGCTIMRIPPVAKFDVGDIIIQERLQIFSREYALDLRDRLADLGSGMAVNFLTNYKTCIKNQRPQGQHQKSVARKLKPEQGHLKFRSETLDLIDRKVRAYTGFIDIYTICLDGLFVKLEGMVEPDISKALHIDWLLENLHDCDRAYSANIRITSRIPAGFMYFHKIRRLLCIKCADMQWLAFEWATPNGKPKMSAADFNNGYLSKVGEDGKTTDS